MKAPILALLPTLALGVTAQADDPWAHPTVMTIVMVDDRFQPDQVMFDHGKAYQLRLENKGKHLHEFTAPAFFRAATIKDKALLANGGKEIVVQPGRTVRVLLIAPAAGHYELTCADHDWEGMVGGITVD